MLSFLLTKARMEYLYSPTLSWVTFFIFFWDSLFFLGWMDEVSWNTIACVLPLWDRGHVTTGLVTWPEVRRNRHFEFSLLIWVLIVLIVLGRRLVQIQFHLTQSFGNLGYVNFCTDVLHKYWGIFRVILLTLQSLSFFLMYCLCSSNHYVWLQMHQYI